VKLIRRLAMGSLAPVIAPGAVLGGALLAWQGGLFHALFGFKEFTVPFPATIVGRFPENGPVILAAVAVTLPAALLGYGFGAAAGLAAGSILVQVWPRMVDRVLPIMSATNSVPIVALAPLVALFTGPGLPLKVIVVTIMTAPVAMVYTVRGLLSVDPTAIELMDSLNATSRQVYSMVRFQTALPFVLTALKSSVVLALIGTIVSEAVRGFEGLGYIIVDSMGKFQAALAWLALIAIATIGIGWYIAVEILERFMVPWEGSRRNSR
jgi:NitT/TauT family transport system permease protein